MKVMAYLCILKRSVHLISKYELRCVLNTGLKLSTTPQKRNEQFVIWFSSLRPNSHNEPVQEADEQKILHDLNTLSAEQMSQDKKIASKMSESICKYREVNGMFTTVKDLENVKYIGPRNLKTICERLTAEVVDSNKKSSTDEKSLLKWINPELTSDLIKSVSTVTSLEVCIDSVCFCTMSRDMHVLDWNHVTLKGSNHKKQSPAQILDQAVYVLDHLPKASIVLMENRLSRKLTPTYLQYVLFIARLQMALQALINEDLRTAGQHKVFQINDSFIAKTFDLRVGGERVSGQYIMQTIQDQQFSQKLSIAPKFWQPYNRLESIFRERYANCILTSLAFCEGVTENRSIGQIDSS